MNKRIIIFGMLVAALPSLSYADKSPTPQQLEQRYINLVSKEYHFKKSYLQQLLDRIKLIPHVVAQIKKPHEDMPWYKYWPIFIQPERMRAGVIYWVNHKATLKRAEKIYGVPADIIVAIVGVESYYGDRAGTFPVLNTLVTLSFTYPPRAPFFQSELTQYLLLTREQNLNPTKVLGSYAGALGLPQFMPSSYRKYAVDFNRSHKKDLFHDTADVIGSIGNYLKAKGWLRNYPIAVPATVTGNRYQKLLNNELNTKYSLKTWAKYGVKPTEKLSRNYRANLIKLQTKNGYQYWLGLHNLYVITKYNTHIKYALVVYEFAKEVKKLYEQQG